MNAAVKSGGATWINVERTTMDIQSQCELEQLFNKNQLMKRIRKELREPEMVEYIQAKKLPLDFAIDFMAQMVVHKRASVGTMVGILWHHFEGADEDIEDPLQACADMIYRMIDVDLADYDSRRGEIIIRIDMPADVKAELDRYQYPLPLVIEPKHVGTNRDTGYFTSRGSIILKDNHHEDDVCLDHINRLNKTRLTINADNVVNATHLWARPKRKADESYKDFKDRQKAFDKYLNVSQEVVEHLMLMSETIYITHKYDKRGRTYTQGYHVNPQGHSWNKACIEFADKEVAE